MASPHAAIAGAEVAVVATAWPEYRTLTADEVVRAMKTPRIIDEARFLADTLGHDPRIAHVVVGAPQVPRGSRAP